MEVIFRARVELHVVAGLDWRGRLGHERKRKDDPDECDAPGDSLARHLLHPAYESADSSRRLNARAV
jgi:hypothetical protein